ncbi:MAG: DinB family protein [Chthonomonadales bacterium]
MVRNELNPHPEMESQLAALFGSLEEATRDSRSDLLDMLADPKAITWQPFEDGHSVGTILLHIIDVEAWWISECGAGIPRTDEEKKRFLSEETQQGKEIWPTSPDMPIEWFFEQHDIIRKRSAKIVAKWIDQNQEISVRDHVITTGWLLAHVTAHEAYHYGQSMLLLMLYNRQVGK